MVERGKNHHGKHTRPSAAAVLARLEPGHWECRDCRAVIPVGELLGGAKRPRCPKCGGAVERVAHREG